MNFQSSYFYYTVEQPKQRMYVVYFFFPLRWAMSIPWNVILLNISCQQDIARIPPVNRNTGDTVPNSYSIFDSLHLLSWGLMSYH